ncbi:MAG: alkaline phosphatase PhoX [Halorientalis sp.]
MVDLNRRNLMKSSAAAALGASVVGIASGDVNDDTDRDTPGAPSVVGSIKRFSTTAYGAEVTGPFVFEDGGLLYSLQHPSGDNPAPFGTGGIGYFKNFTFELDGDNDDFQEVSIPTTKEAQRKVRSANHDYVLLAQGRDEINGGSERLGVTETPDGTEIIENNFHGAKYIGAAGGNPDCNQFVATNDAGTEGYLFTNWENNPGNVSRIPLSQRSDGEWEADLENAMNLANTQALRDLGGTHTNCYGDLSPWNTMISSEEHYGSPRVSYGHTVSEIVESGTGKGKIGGNEFWNRPNPTEPNIDFTAQGVWSQDSAEPLAYYLGAKVRKGLEPIGDVYPNRYRYGYHIDFRQPAAETPQPVKYYVMGRAAWEAPNIQADKKTVYEAADGDNKGIYKFVADEPIDSYDDPMDVAGTLYAPKITPVADERVSPAETDLEVEWLPLGHASNRECEEWIAEYDDVTQVDYLEAHTDNWSEGDEVTEDVLTEADQYVVENGNQNYITNEEIVEWARQYEENGHDGVDEDLRKVPFLETRAAAKEIGASIEFNKAEGVDSRDGAAPGEYVYFGISEFNDALADESGDIQLDQVNGGVVYRAELESDYDVSRLEPVITGPDFRPGDAKAANHAVSNVDNVYVMDDGRVLCCEDGFNEGPAEYPNDSLYVYQPPVDIDVESAAISRSGTAEVDLTVSSLPNGFSGARLTVSISDGGVAEITGASYNDALGITAAPKIAADGQSVELRVADLGGEIQPGAQNVTLGTLEIEAVGTGTADLEISVHNMDAEDGSEIDVQERMGMVVTGPPAIGPGGSAPTDPDGDGLYEDVNGNGRMDYADIELLFENLDSEAVTGNVSAYDFNENGQIDYDDVVELYQEQ